MRARVVLHSPVEEGELALVGEDALAVRVATVEPVQHVAGAGHVRGHAGKGE